MLKSLPVMRGREHPPTVQESRTVGMRTGQLPLLKLPNAALQFEKVSSAENRRVLVQVQLLRLMKGHGVGDDVPAMISWTCSA